jgi:hypothetical protein
VRGFADRNLKHPDQPLDFANRRVSILVATSLGELAKAEAFKKPETVPGISAVIPGNSPTDTLQGSDKK